MSKRTLKDLATAVIANLDATYDLVYIDQGDKLTDEQVAFLVSGEHEKLFESTEEFESDARWTATSEIIKDAAAEVIRTWEAEDVEFGFSGIAEELIGSEEYDEIRFAIEERDTSDWLRQLAAGTPDVLLRINVFNEDDAYDHEDVRPDDALIKVGLPVTEGNVKIMAETLANASPEFSVLLGYWIVGANVEELYKLTDSVTEIEITNPYLYLGNPFAGKGFISEDPFEGTVKVKRADLRTDKDAFGYSVNELYGGLNASTFSATLTPVTVAAPEGAEDGQG